MSNIATIGHNQPPPSPFELMAEHITDLHAEAVQWLDGEPVTTQQQAEALNTLENRIREAAKDAEAMRKAEVDPLDDAKAEIQDRFNALIGKTTKITGKTVAAIEAIKAALRPYLLELDRKIQEDAERARKEGEAAQAVAAKAMAERDRSNLAQNEEAERLAVLAKEAEQTAARIAKEKARAKGDGRATGLRTVWTATMTDERAAAGWIWKEHHAELIEFIQGHADRAAKNGKRAIDGFEITSHKEV